MKNDTQLCDFFCNRVAHAYLLHLVATWRKPVYRYESGDIEVNQSFLAGLFDDCLRIAKEWAKKLEPKKK